MNVNHYPVLAMLALMGPFASAQPNVDLELAQLKVEIARLEQRLAHIKAIVAQYTEAEPQSAVQPPPPVLYEEWATLRSRTSLAWSGDLRYMHETIDDHALPIDHRHRLRARGQIVAAIDDRMKLGFGVATGDVKNDSANQTLGDGFSRKPLELDLAYFDWRLSDAAHLLGGKMRNPFYRPADHHLLYDDDLRPEGLALKFRQPSAFVNASVFWTQDRGHTPDSMWWGLQAGYRLSPFDAFSLTTGASYYETTHTRGYPPLFTPFSGQGNYLDASGNYLYGFSQWELFGELTLERQGFRFTAFLDYVYNAVADRFDEGLAAGLSFRRVSVSSPWTIAYTYQDLQANAVVAAFTDSDFAAGTSDGSGSILKAAYEFPMGWTLALRYITGVRGESTGLRLDYDRLQVHLEFVY
ncbi:MAG: putative porin [Rhodospirillaceae bacterium]|nr:putative porin [Rhodospirillaceae bacterium]MDE0362173.1 putative porin [Rhodospirillaceae bacterium]